MPLGYDLYNRWKRVITSSQAPNAADSDDLIGSPSGTNYRLAAGSGTLVSGTATIATGLNTVASFTANMSRSTGTSTGGTEVNTIWVGAITTGSVVVTGSFNSFVTGAATPSASGTSSFYWLAIGT